MLLIAVTGLLALHGHRRNQRRWFEFLTNANGGVA
jgi:hypothetical protein